MMPSTDELTRIRADMVDATLPSTGNILSLTRTSDGQGGFTDTWGTATASVACRLDLMTRNLRIGIESVNAMSIKPYSAWVLSLPNGTVITAANRFEFGDDVYNVVEVNDNSSWLANVRATLEKV
jgi:head-tail adaptor